MDTQAHSPTPLDQLHTAFGDLLQENILMANYTTAHVGGPVDAALIAQSAAELENSVQRLWQMNIPFYLLGSGSNVLVSDAGIRGVVVINRAHTVKIDTHTNPPTVWAESGANLSGMARQLALRGLSGLEWAANVPGSVGGAVYGNAGAFGMDIKSSLILAEILHRKEGMQNLSSARLEFDYRTSILKHTPGQAIVLAARFGLATSTKDEVQARMDSYTAQRRHLQPPGASLGSMFKNPKGDYAGRLIEAAGLKGTRIGGAQISKLHANFFVNDQQASAKDIWELIQLARRTVQDKFGVNLELEVELLGDWPEVYTGQK
jgi:UDP-N-acetylmuramate dehydrogenase